MIDLEQEATFMNDRGTFTEERSIYTEGFSVKKKNGKRYHADAIYKVRVSVHAWQTGNAKFPDNRECHFQIVDRRLLRDIILTDADGHQSNEGQSDIALGGIGNKKDSKNNCNECMVDSDQHIQYLRTHLGDYPTHQDVIRDDLVRVKEILEIIGTVSPEIEFGALQGS